MKILVNLNIQTEIEIKKPKIEEILPTLSPWQRQLDNHTQHKTKKEDKEKQQISQEIIERTQKEITEKLKQTGLTITIKNMIMCERKTWNPKNQIIHPCLAILDAIDTSRHIEFIE